MWNLEGKATKKNKKRDIHMYIYIIFSRMFSQAPGYWVEAKLRQVLYMQNMPAMVDIMNVNTESETEFSEFF